MKGFPSEKRIGNDRVSALTVTVNRNPRWGEDVSSASRLA